MFSRGFYLTPLFLGATFFAHAQDATEAFNLSNLSAQGTARSMSIGGALGSIGGDFSSLSVNPAGIGVYRMSELTFTPSIKFNSAEGQYQGTAASNSNTRFNINNFGIVLTNAPRGKRYDQRAWKSVSFAFGMNRMADYNRSYTYQGANSSSSMTQVFESDANYDTAGVNSYPPYNGLGYLGYQAFLIDPTLGGQYVSVVPFRGGINQMKDVTERGRVTEYTISFGGNYKEKLMLGGTIGIPDVRYDYTSRYSEWMLPGNLEPNPAQFSSFRLDQYISLKGSGINLKLGAIYKINENFRVGGAFHTPTYYDISDLYKPYMTSLVGGIDNILSIDNQMVSESVFKYSFISPYRAIASISFVKKGYGFITADYEFVDYSSMRFYYPYGFDLAGYNMQQAETQMNNYLKNYYHGASNFRIGAEGILGKYFMARLGFGYYGSPYRSYSDNQRFDFSGGLGFHFENFFTDIAYVRSIYSQEQAPYQIDYSTVYSSAPAPTPTANIDFAINNFAWTVGVKF